jgi:hypothetical protein
MGKGYILPAPMATLKLNPNPESTTPRNPVRQQFGDSFRNWKMNSALPNNVFTKAKRPSGA